MKTSNYVSRISDRLPGNLLESTGACLVEVKPAGGMTGPVKSEAAETEKWWEK
jgi:hypothetical protein